MADESSCYGRIIVFMVCAWQFACSRGVVSDIEQVHIVSRSNQYLLADLPLWANFSGQGGCRWSDPIRFLHYGRLRKSYSYSYSSLAQLQLAFNERYHVMRQELPGALLSPGMEEKLFFQAQGAIDSKIFPFHVPQFKRVHLLWIDPAQSSLPYRKALQRVLDSRAFYRGHPVLISQCLNRQQMVRWVERWVKKDVDFRFISSELFSPFGRDFKLANRYQLYIDAILPGRELVFYSIQGRVVDALKGQFELEQVE